MNKREDGQVLAEFALGVTLIAVVIAGGAWVFRAQWERGQCAYWAFEAAHLRLSGRWLADRSSRIANVPTIETPDGVSAVARCGSATETVRLKRLMEISW